MVIFLCSFSLLADNNNDNNTCNNNNNANNTYIHTCTYTDTVCTCTSNTDVIALNSIVK